MKYQELINYIKVTEKMIRPADVARVNQASSFLQKLPLRLQTLIANSGAKKNPYMGFVVEPYSFFMSIEITNQEVASKLLPKGYRLTPVSMFEHEEPRLCAIMGAFNIHTSVFWGSRLELYLIAENIKTGLMSWIIADYETNTNSFDPGQGFTGPSTAHSVMTTSYNGEVIIDVKGKKSGKRLALTADLNEAKRTMLNQRLWVEGNLSVDYGGSLDAGTTQPFGLIFDPKEMQSALKLPLSDISIDENSLGSDFLAKHPFEVACFPYAQHFVTTSMPADIGLRNAEQLELSVVQFSKDQSGKAEITGKHDPITAINAAIKF